MSCKYKVVILFLALFLVSPLVAQKQKVDSLENILRRHSRNDRVKVDLMNEIAYLVFTNDMHKAVRYVSESEELSERLNYPKGKAMSLWVKGLTYLRRDKRQALKYLNQSLSLAEKIKDRTVICNALLAIGNVQKDLGESSECDRAYDRALLIAKELNDRSLVLKCLVNMARNSTKGGHYHQAIERLEESIVLANELGDSSILSKIYNNLGWIYNLQCNYPVALECYFKALSVNEKIHDRSSMIVNYINISGVQADQKEYPEALKTLQKALKLSEALCDTLRSSICLANIGNIYLSMKDSRALKYYEESLKIVKDNNITQSVNILVNMGVIHTQNKNYNQALRTLNEALLLAKKAGLKRSFGEIWSKVGTIYFYQKKYAEALSYCNNSLAIANELNLMELQKEVHKQLSEIYAATNDYRSAYLNHILYKNYNDSIFSENNIKKIANLENAYKYEKAKQSYEIEKQSREIKIKSQRIIILSLVAAFILLLLSGFMTFRSSRLKKQLLQIELQRVNEELEKNQKAMTSATLKLVQTAERDSRSIRMLENIEKNTSSEGRDEIKSLISDYKFQASNSNWDEFEILFQKVHSSFYKDLNDQFPTLTPNERKLCVFLKLNMTNKQIAQITFQSEDALKKARLRLRKKLEIDRETNLGSFIQNI